MRRSREWHTWTRFDSRRRWCRRSRRAHERLGGSFFTPCQFLLLVGEARRVEIGRASCRERVEIWGVAVSLKKKKTMSDSSLPASEPPPAPGLPHHHTN